MQDNAAQRTGAAVQYWWRTQKWYIEIFMVKIVVGILITQTRKFMTANICLDKDLCDQTGKPSIPPFPLS